MDWKTSIAELIARAIGLAFPGTDAPQDIPGMLEVPPDTNMGDYAFPCFRLSKLLKMGPPQIAGRLNDFIDAPDLARAEYHITGMRGIQFRPTRGPILKHSGQAVRCHLRLWLPGHITYI